MKFLSIILLLNTLQLSAQTKDINNTLSAKHQFISGTKIAMIPPKDFIKATSFSGFQQSETNASIIVAVMPAPFNILERGFTDEALKSKGMTILSKQKLNFQNDPAIVYIVKQGAQGLMFGKYILLSGNSKESVIINGTFPDGNTNLEKQMWQAMQTAIYQKDKIVNPLQEADFNIDLSGTKLKFANTLAGTYLFNTDGELIAKSAQTGFFSIGQSISPVNAEDKKQFAIERLTNLPNGSKTTIDQIEAIEIDGMNGFEIIGYGEDNKANKNLVYQVFLYFDSSYYLMAGMAFTDFEDYLKQFKSIARSFKRK